MQDWSDFVGVPFDTPKEVCFMILADPRFSQVEQMVEGLDYAFPDSAKIGGLLSMGSRPRTRALFAWSAEADGRGGDARPNEQQRRRRRGRKPREVTVLRQPGGNGNGLPADVEEAVAEALASERSGPSTSGSSSDDGGLRGRDAFGDGGSGGNARGGGTTRPAKEEGGFFGGL
eukprot:351282-Chlamydomonas_euryale.AAC.6